MQWVEGFEEAIVAATCYDSMNSKNSSRIEPCV